MTQVSFKPSFDRKMEAFLKKVGEKLVKDVQKIVQSETSGTGELESSYKYRINARRQSVEVYSDLPQAKYVEYGTGQRGQGSFKRYFKEHKPKFTVPIVPRKSKVLAWKSGDQTVFARSTRGMFPVAPLRRAMFAFRGKQKLK